MHIITPPENPSAKVIVFLLVLLDIKTMQAPKTVEIPAKNESTSAN